MPWGGYNFEDSILVSERLVKDDSFTSVHIEEFECVARDTKLGKEEITRDIPERRRGRAQGPRRVGHRAASAPRSNPATSWSARSRRRARPSLAPEEKLLRAIFGEKAGDVRDSSLRVPPGVKPAWSSTLASSPAREPRRTSAPCAHRRDGEGEAPDQPARRDQDHLRLLLRADAQAVVGKTTAGTPGRRQGQVLIRQGTRSSTRPNPRLVRGPSTGTRSRSTVPTARSEENSSSSWPMQREDDVHAIETQYARQDLKLTKGDELPPGVIKLVKVYVAIKRKLVGRRQDGRSPRQQGRGLPPASRGGHAVPQRRYPGRYRPEPSRRAVADERRTDPRDPPRLGGARKSATRSTPTWPRSGRPTCSGTR